MLYFFLLGITAAMGNIRADMPTPPARRIVFIGDSITDGFTYPLLYRQALATAGRPVPLLFNAGIGGDTAHGVRQRLDRDVFVHQPDLVTLSIGINDVLHDVTLADYSNDVRAIVAALRGKGLPVVILTTTTLGPKQAAKHAALAAYNQFLRELAKEQGCRLAEVNERLAKATEPIHSPDDIHINFAGYRLMTRALLDALGCTELPVPATLKITAAPGLVTPWRLKAITDEKAPALTAETVAAVKPDATWVTLELPEPTPEPEWWPNDVRQEGFARSVVKVAGPGTRYLGYAAVESPRARPACLNTGAHLQRVWLNGMLVFEAKGWTGYHAGKERIAVDLVQGRNALVIETTGEFFLSLTDSRDW
jgi:lysophospholipase L1-like esterase